MNTTDMKFYFKQNGVSDEYYVIDELGGGEVDGVGQIDGRWATYYSERGKKRNIKYFNNEDEACQALIKMVSRRVEVETGKPLPPTGTNVKP